MNRIRRFIAMRIFHIEPIRITSWYVTPRGDGGYRLHINYLIRSWATEADELEYVVWATDWCLKRIREKYKLDLEVVQEGQLER